jgi:hypothetical protein
MNDLKKGLFLLLVLILCIGSAGAITENFQSWGVSGISVSSGSGVSLNTPSVGNISLIMGPQPSSWVNTNPVYWTYAGFDSVKPDTVDRIYLLDSSYNAMNNGGFDGSPYQGMSVPANARIEIKLIGMVPTVFINGVQTGTYPCTGTNAPSCNINPSYLEIVDYTGGRLYDNILIGESDPHVVGALPSNWSIIRDLLNPAATGVFAWNNATQTWVSQNSQYFYINADTSSQQSATTEYFDILNYNTGLIVNTTAINDQTSPYNQLQFNINTFLNTVTNLGTQLPDGEYTAEFRGYPTSAAYFWVTSSGAVVSWDKTSYPQNAQATLTYTISPSYYQPSTYTYSLAVVSTTGQTLQTYILNSATGTETLPLNSATFPPGAYYAEILATPVGGGTAQIMNYAATQVTSYVYISGYVLNAETASPLTNANVTITQTGTSASALTGANGAYTISNGWLTGSTISMQTNLSGYTTDVNSFIPLGAGNLNITIPLLSTNATHTGVSIGGIVRDNQYGNPVPSATVNVYNTSTSESYNNVTNIAGYYLVNNLVGNRLYNVSSTKSGYSNSTIAQVVAVGV